VQFWLLMDCTFYYFSKDIVSSHIIWDYENNVFIFLLSFHYRMYTSIQPRKIVIESSNADAIRVSADTLAYEYTALPPAPYQKHFFTHGHSHQLSCCGRGKRHETRNSWGTKSHFSSFTLLGKAPYSGMFPKGLFRLALGALLWFVQRQLLWGLQLGLYPKPWRSKSERKKLNNLNWTPTQHP